MAKNLLSGIDTITAKELQTMGNIALVTNQSAITRNYIPTAQRIYDLIGTNLQCILGPQHGYFFTEQDNMKETPDTIYPLGEGIPLYSLYGKYREPQQQHLQYIDTIIIDLQDVGCRIFTYMMTLAGCLKTAAQMGKKVVILDRPNPLGLSHKSLDAPGHWDQVEGNLWEDSLESFIGKYPIPFCHGMTLGELGYLFIDLDQLELDYQVIPVQGLTRKTSHQEISFYLPPSPNLPCAASIYFFPVGVAFEGANVSEGRGTTTPFQLMAAPYIDSQQVIQELDLYKKEFKETFFSFEGCYYHPYSFRPTFNKHQGEVCHGLFFHKGEGRIHLFALSLFLQEILTRLYPSEFKWIQIPYEYNEKDLPIHLIHGTKKWTEFFRSSDQRKTLKEWIPCLEESQSQADQFSLRYQKYFIYKD
jgi:uncharacterized protein YbbC (DUF1343 family)